MPSEDVLGKIFDRLEDLGKLGVRMETGLSNLKDSLGEASERWDDSAERFRSDIQKQNENYLTCAARVGFPRVAEQVDAVHSRMMMVEATQAAGKKDKQTVPPRNISGGNNGDMSPKQWLFVGKVIGYITAGIIIGGFIALTAYFQLK